jgi:NAD(P)-dependent dehydrogenase (short-subunit alcohol dehydrogenase family)
VTGRYEGKVAIVTGAAGGIGEGVARRLVAEGALCVVADVRADHGRAVAESLGRAARFQQVDVTNEEDVARVVEYAVAEFGRLDCMFNNAGVLGVTGSLIDTDRADWTRSMDILLTSVFLGIKHSARVMREQGSGSIVNTASTAGVRGGLGPHAYTAAKHAVVGLTASAAVELMPVGVRVNAIAPGATVSGMTASVITGDPNALDVVEQRLAQRFGRAAQPDDVAAAAAFLASDEAWYVNGACLVIDAGSEVLGSKARRYFGPPDA